jgi:hypothetical protein
MVSDDYLKKRIEEAHEKRASNAERLRRRIELGYIKGKVYPDGTISYQTSPKGIQNWHDTRTLVRLVTEIFDRNEKVCGRRICHINGKWQLQIRGKHLRRLLKAMPKVKQVGRLLIEEKNS